VIFLSQGLKLWMLAGNLIPIVASPIVGGLHIDQHHTLDPQPRHKNHYHKHCQEQFTRGSTMRDQVPLHKTLDWGGVVETITNHSSFNGVGVGNRQEY
jgi:hypothetical protein